MSFSEIKDIQSQPDHRRLDIQKVGVKNIAYPITVLDKAKKLQRTVATVNMYVNLPHHFKGTHMSRFIEILNRFHGEINLRSFHHILTEMKLKLQAQAAHMEIEFPYFLKKNTSSANDLGISEYTCRMHGSLTETDDLVLNVRVPISLPRPAQIIVGLPRSYGHWGFAEICLRFGHFIWMEDVIKIVEEVTTQHLNANPQGEQNTSLSKHLTVETLTKALGEKLSKLKDISWFSITVENLSEGYSTFASVESTNKPLLVTIP